MVSFDKYSFRVLLLCIFAFLINEVTPQIACTWTGASNTNWNTDSNWDCGVVPDGLAYAAYVNTGNIVANSMITLSTLVSTNSYITFQYGVNIQSATVQNTLMQLYSTNTFSDLDIDNAQLYMQFESQLNILSYLTCYSGTTNQIYGLAEVVLGSSSATSLNTFILLSEGIKVTNLGTVTFGEGGALTIISSQFINSERSLIEFIGVGIATTFNISSTDSLFQNNGNITVIENAEAEIYGYGTFNNNGSIILEHQSYISFQSPSIHLGNITSNPSITSFVQFDTVPQLFDSSLFHGDNMQVEFLTIPNLELRGLFEVYLLTIYNCSMVQLNLGPQPMNLTMTLFQIITSSVIITQAMSVDNIYISGSTLSISSPSTSTIKNMQLLDSSLNVKSPICFGPSIYIQNSNTTFDASVCTSRSSICNKCFEDYIAPCRTSFTTENFYNCDSDNSPVFPFPSIVLDNYWVC